MGLTELIPIVEKLPQDRDEVCPLLDHDAMAHRELGLL